MRKHFSLLITFSLYIQFILLFYKLYGFGNDLSMIIVCLPTIIMVFSFLFISVVDHFIFLIIHKIQEKMFDRSLNKRNKYITPLRRKFYDGK